MAQSRVVIVCTSHDKLGTSNQKTGAWLEEVAAPYYVFKHAGLDVTLASIKGGPVPFDNSSLSGDFFTPDAQAFWADGDAKAQVESSVALSDIKPEDYDAVFVAGGHGIAYDGPYNQEVQRVVGGIYAAGGVVSAVCHGPCALVGVTGPDLVPIVDGKKVTAFTNAEEEAVQKVEFVPWLLQDKLKEVGGLFVVGPPWSVHVEQDGTLVTGQNPQSSKAVAEAVVKLVHKPVGTVV